MKMPNPGIQSRMGNLILYIAASLDGFIARRDGAVDWLDSFNQPGEDYGYKALLERIGTIVMGGNTYRQVLGFGVWPYAEQRAIIVTTQPLENPPGENIHAFAGDVGELVRREKEHSSKDIWLIGGGQLIGAFLAQRLVDEYMISWIPVFLGSGIPLSSGVDVDTSMRLIGETSFSNGVLQAHYSVS